MFNMLWFQHDFTKENKRWFWRRLAPSAFVSINKGSVYHPMWTKSVCTELNVSLVGNIKNMQLWTQTCHIVVLLIYIYFNNTKLKSLMKTVLSEFVCAFLDFLFFTVFCMFFYCILQAAFLFLRESIIGYDTSVYWWQQQGELRFSGWGDFTLRPPVALLSPTWLQQRVLHKGLKFCCNVWTSAASLWLSLRQHHSPEPAPCKNCQRHRRGSRSVINISSSRLEEGVSL